MSHKIKQKQQIITEKVSPKYHAEEIRKQMRADFKRATKDEQTLDLSEWGMDDYHNIVIS